jgi:hypothetical protein
MMGRGEFCTYDPETVIVLSDCLEEAGAKVHVHTHAANEKLSVICWSEITTAEAHEAHVEMYRRRGLIEK